MFPAAVSGTPGCGRSHASLGATAIAGRPPIIRMELMRRKGRAQVRIHLRTKDAQKGYGIAYDHVGYAVSFCSCCGISTTPMKFHQMTRVCFFVRVPGTFSGFFTSIFSTKDRMISAVSAVMSVYRRTIPKKELHSGVVPELPQLLSPVRKLLFPIASARFRRLRTFGKNGRRIFSRRGYPRRAVA